MPKDSQVTDPVSSGTDTAHKFTSLEVMKWLARHEPSDLNTDIVDHLASIIHEKLANTDIANPPAAEKISRGLMHALTNTQNNTKNYDKTFAYALNKATMAADMSPFDIAQSLNDFQNNITIINEDNVTDAIEEVNNAKLNIAKTLKIVMGNSSVAQFELPVYRTLLAEKVLDTFDPTIDEDALKGILVDAKMKDIEQLGRPNNTPQALQNPNDEIVEKLKKIIDEHSKPNERKGNIAIFNNAIDDYRDAISNIEHINLSHDKKTSDTIDPPLMSDNDFHTAGSRYTNEPYIATDTSNQKDSLTGQPYNIELDDSTLMRDQPTNNITDPELNALEIKTLETVAIEAEIERQQAENATERRHAEEIEEQRQAAKIDKAKSEIYTHGRF